MSSSEPTSRLLRALARTPGWLRVAAVVAAAGVVDAACALNPQPIPPEDTIGATPGNSSDHGDGGGRGGSDNGSSSGLTGSSSGGGSADGGNQVGEPDGGESDAGEPDAGEDAGPDGGVDLDAGAPQEDAG